MDRSRSIQSGGWLGSATSVLTFGYFGYSTEEIIGAPYVLLADVEIRLLALRDVAMRLTASADRSVRLLTDVADLEL